MATVTLTKDNISSVINDNAIVIIDFWAEWCGPCKRFAPVFEEISEKYPDIVFAKVDTQAEPEVAGYFQIRAIPTLAVFRDQVGIYQNSGAMPPHAFEELIGQVRETDMDEVRKKIAEQKEQPPTA
ncbi:MAG: thioredoxin 1 [Myxococcota bacterium]